MNNSGLQLLQTIDLLNKKVSTIWARQIPHQVSMQQMFLLLELAQRGSQKSSELAKRLSITPGAITGISEKLISMGLITRQSSDEDRRVVCLDLTDEGRELVQQLGESGTTIRELLFGCLSEKERYSLAVMYEKLIHHLNSVPS